MFKYGTRVLCVLALAGGCAGVAIAVNQTPPAPQPARSTPPQNVRDFAELERMAMAEVPYIKEIEVRDLLLKVEGHDAQGMKVKLYMDRRTGQVLSREVKYDKRGPFGRPFDPRPAGYR
jgi:hypothetical protein